MASAQGGSAEETTAVAARSPEASWEADA